jgi:FKBP-type peptidyl-prolyl cis-trans isomerase
MAPERVGIGALLWTCATSAALVGALGCKRAGGRLDPAPDAGLMARATSGDGAVVRSPPRFPPPDDVAAPPEGARQLASGVAVKLLKAGTGTDRPQADDCVKVAFTGWHRDGSLLSTSRVHDDPVVHCLRRTMPGLAIALREMVVGEEDRIWIPGALTFKSSEPGEEAPKSDLTFDVGVLEIIRAPAVPAELAPPKMARTTASGLAYRVLSPGTGATHPSPSSRVHIRFSGWMKDGTLFASTASARTPAVFSMSDVILGWREGLVMMVPGEKARFWVPGKLAFGDKPRRGGQPWGDLVYDVELVDVDGGDTKSGE